MSQFYTLQRKFISNTYKETWCVSELVLEISREKNDYLTCGVFGQLVTREVKNKTLNSYFKPTIYFFKNFKGFKI